MQPWQLGAKSHVVPCAHSAQNLPPSQTGKLLLIKGLPKSIDEEYLIAIFKSYGTVKWARMAAVSESEDTRGGEGKSGYVCFASQDGSASALLAMDGAEVCGVGDDGDSSRGTCTHITVDLGNSQNSASELASQRLLSRLHAVKRELRLYKRIQDADSSFSTTLPADTPLTPLNAINNLSSPVSTNGSVSGNLASRGTVDVGKAIGPDVDDVNEKFNQFLQGLRSLMPQSAPTAHASISNVSALGLACSSSSAPPSPSLNSAHILAARGKISSMTSFHHQYRGKDKGSRSDQGRGQENPTSKTRTDHAVSQRDTARGRGGRWVVRRDRKSVV